MLLRMSKAILICLTSFLLNGFLHWISVNFLEMCVSVSCLLLNQSYIKHQSHSLFKHKFKTFDFKAILIQPILTFFPQAIKELNGKQHHNTSFMWNENQGHGWKATACWKATKMSKPSTHSYGGSIFANSTCEDYTKVVCTGKYGSCDSTESWEYFHLNIQYWDLQWKRKKKLKTHKHTKARFNTSGALKHSTFQRSICCIPFPPSLLQRLKFVSLFTFLQSTSENGVFYQSCFHQACHEVELISVTWKELPKAKKQIETETQKSHHPVTKWENGGICNLFWNWLQDAQLQPTVTLGKARGTGGD